MHVPVLYEDSNIIALDKPSGIVVHPFDFSHEETLLDFLKDHYPEVFSIKNEFALQDGRTFNFGGVVHKLDRDTSGVLIVARNEETFSDLKQQFEKRTTRKTYTALIEGKLEKEIFRIDAPLGRNKKEYKQSVNPANPRGTLREAITDVKAVERRAQTTVVELVPITGRTHQLRAHMSSIGHPIVGDVAYGSTQKSERIMLHASSITFSVHKNTMTVTSPLPETFL